MASQLRADYFKFNGINSRLRNYRIVITENQVGNVPIFGIQRNINEETGYNGRPPIFYSTESICPEFQITIMKLDENDNMLSYLDGELNQIAEWLFQTDEEYKPLQVNNRVYYGMFIKGESWRDDADNGYITGTFRMATPYSFSFLRVYDVIVNESKIINLKNKSTASNIIYPDIYIEMLEKSSSLRITNLNNGNQTFLNGLLSNSKIEIFNQEQQMICYNNKKENPLIKSNMSFIGLQQGINRIKIEANGKIKVQFSFQNEMSLN